jgi:hypothetical protein
MHQDAYIFQRLDLGGIEYAEYLDHGISSCSLAGDKGKLDADVGSLWTRVLRHVYPDAKAPLPNPDAWHSGFQGSVDKIAESGRRLFPLARHVAQGLGLMYPLRTEVDPQFIYGLATPSGIRMSYDEIFDKAVANVQDQWRTMAAALAGTAEFPSAEAWNLDTGRDGDRYVYWEVA